VIGFEDQIKRMYAEKLFCDISFEVEGKKFEAHKGILASRSQYFTNMFNSKETIKYKNSTGLGGMIESQTDTIPVPDVKAHVFEGKKIFYSEARFIFLKHFWSLFMEMVLKKQS